MLEFIVLGIIPGTQIQLSPTGVILLWSGILLLARFIAVFRSSYRLLDKYDESGTYFTLVAKKHLITRRLRS